MYMNGALVHADNVFNGYSNTKKDFMKQVTIIYDEVTIPYLIIIQKKKLST